jgi:hypothetical protein
MQRRAEEFTVGAAVHRNRRNGVACRAIDSPHHNLDFSGIYLLADLLHGPQDTPSDFIDAQTRWNAHLVQ